jgi:hypothetical protein
VRQKGGQRVWEAEINFRRQEPLSDISVQPQASPSSKEGGNEEEALEEERASISSVQTNSNDGGERGDQQIAEHATHRLSEASSTYDLSFLANYDQRNYEQRDDLCTCIILPYPFCSSSIHYRRPDPVTRSAIGTPQAFPSPPASGDNTLHQLLPHNQRQDLSFEMGTIDTESLDISALASTTCWSQSSFKKTCQCLAEIIFALEKLEASCNSGSRAGLVSIVANQKDVIQLCRSMLKCSSCMAKRENFVFLVFMSERIVVACGPIVTLYRMEDGGIRTSTAPPSQLGCLATEQLSNDKDIDNQGLATSASKPSRTCSRWQELHLGDYEINSALEWDHLVRALINFQLRAAKGLLGDVKSMGTMILGDAQTESLTRAETRISRLEQDMYVI